MAYRNELNFRMFIVVYLTRSYREEIYFKMLSLRLYLAMSKLNELYLAVLHDHT